MNELPLIDSELSQVGWRDWFALNELELPQKPRPSFDRGALSISAAVDGMGVALETRRLAERELARGELIEAGESEFHRISRETHFLSHRSNESHIEKVRSFKEWLFVQVEESECTMKRKGARSTDKGKRTNRSPHV